MALFRFTFRCLLSVNRMSVPEIVQKTRRTIFSQAYLRIPVFASNRDAYLENKTPAEVVESRTKTLAIAEESKFFLSDDLTRLMYSCKSVDDVAETCASLKVFLKNSEERSSVYGHIINLKAIQTFFALCHTLDAVHPALDLFKEENVIQILKLYNLENKGSMVSKFVVLSYCQLLYNHGLYDEVIGFCENNLEMLASFLNLEIFTLALACCVKSTNPAAYDKARLFVKQIEENSVKASLGRAGSIYSLLAIRNEDLVEAYEVLSLVSPSMLNNNLKVDILTRMNRLDDALLVLEGSLMLEDEPSFKQMKHRFSNEVVKNFMTAVNQSKDPVLKRRVTILFNKLDNFAEITKQTLEEVTLSEISNREVRTSMQTSKTAFRPRTPIESSNFSPSLQASLDK